MSFSNLVADITLYIVCCTVIDNIEVTKKIVTLSGLRWKVVSKTAPSVCESVENRDVYKRLISTLYLLFAFIL